MPTCPPFVTANMSQITLNINTNRSSEKGTPALFPTLGTLFPEASDWMNKSVNDALAVQACDLVVRDSTGHEASPKFDPLIIRA